MNRMAISGILLILFGLSLFAISMALGEGGFALFLIFPVFYSTGIYGAIGTLFIFAGFFLLFLSPFYSLSSSPEYHGDYDEHVPSPEDAGKIREDGNLHYGGVLLIGPIPIIFGSDKNYGLYALLGMILILLAMLLLFLMI